MPFSGDSAKLLESILDDIAKIKRFTDGASQQILAEDERVAYAVYYALLRISEAAHRLGNTATELCPDVDWRDIRGLGNRLRHAYDSIDTGLVWTMLENDLPQLKTDVQRALSRLMGNEG